ncbi:hypothetical protein ACHHYP_11444 [Achlya hypogyna]|uniref:Myb-like domain-containing protein n=1 Tax=Achlya hypogyna TaxID=1202772 RepID=A0A1V9YJ44_ACHHY|nr:hypothetical protein ACHHYP_11444 [Achlya hypogyna]
MGKGSKWAANEDNQLALSWVCTSEDAIKGSDQTADSFWATVHAHWSCALGNGGRSAQAIKNRWAIINRATQKFSGYAAQVKNRNESGKTDADMLQDTHALFLALEHKVFHPPAGMSRPIGVKQAKRKVADASASEQKLKELVETKKAKNALFADYMLLQMIGTPTTPEDEALVQELKEEYASKRARVKKNDTNETVV